MRTRSAAPVVLALLYTTACSAGTGSGAADDSKYTQTWAKPYSSTTCADYLNEMTSKQQWVAAADMLTSVRKVDGGTRLPADGLVARFRSDVATGCQSESTAAIGDVAVVIYKLADSYQP